MRARLLSAERVYVHVCALRPSKCETSDFQMEMPRGYTCACCQVRALRLQRERA